MSQIKQFRLLNWCIFYANIFALLIAFEIRIENSCPWQILQLPRSKTYIKCLQIVRLGFTSDPKREKINMQKWCTENCNQHILRKMYHKNPPSYLNRIYSSTCVKKELSVVCKVSLKILIILNGSNYSERMKDFHFEKLPGSKCVVYMYYTSPFRVWIGKKPGSFCWNRPNFSYPN